MCADIQSLPKERLIFFADLSKYCTYRIGGKADVLAFPKNADEMCALWLECQKKGLPFSVLGNGSNVLILDGGIRGVTACTKKMNELSFEGDRLIFEAGAMLPLAAREAVKRGLKGLEWAFDIPATMGGAAVMNAGAFGFCMADTVQSLTVFFDQRVQKIGAKECRFEHRKSALSEGAKAVVLGGELRLEKSDKNQLELFAEAVHLQRDRTQPKEFSSAGSVFKALKTGAAGMFIEKCGLKGLKSGAAEVSKKHANFIINHGGATAQNVLELVQICQQNVLEKFGEKLELELKILGEKN